LGSSTHVRLSLAPLKIGISQIVVCYCRLLPPRSFCNFRQTK
jgi:hypothetical protein